jgi:hypothetical protein
MFRGKEIRPLGFSHRGELIGERASSEVGPVGLTMGRCGQGLGRAPTSNSENISYVTFLKHKDIKKQGTDTVASC